MENTEGSSLASAHADLDSLGEEMSKFEKHGDKYFTKVLNHQLHQMNSERNLVVESSLEKYQIEAVLAVRAHFNKPEVREANLKALIIAPPGSGKSGMVTLIPYVLESKKVLILTPSKIISEQLAADFGHPDIQTTPPFFMKCGLYQKPGHLNYLLERVHLAVTQKDIDNIRASNLVIVNAQKFGGRSGSSLSATSGRSPEQKDRVLKQLDEFDTIIVDEAHHYPAKTWVNIVQIFEKKKVVFLTATPFRGDAHMTELLNKNVSTVFEISSGKLVGKTIRKTEFIERPAASEVLGDPEFLNELKNHIDEFLGKHDAQENRAKPHQAMILVRKKAEAEEVAQGLGSTATVVISDKEGNRNLDDFAKGRKRIVVVCGMLQEGYDNPNVSLVVILRKCKSRVLFEQFCGRCMRVNRYLTGKDIDRTTGTVLSYHHFNQSALWAKRREFSMEDPEEDPEDGGEEEGEAGKGVWLMAERV